MISLPLIAIMYAKIAFMKRNIPFELYLLLDLCCKAVTLCLQLEIYAMMLPSTVSDNHNNI